MRLEVEFDGRQITSCCPTSSWTIDEGISFQALWTIDSVHSAALEKGRQKGWYFRVITDKTWKKSFNVVSKDRTYRRDRGMYCHCGLFSPHSATEWKKRYKNR